MHFKAAFACLALCLAATSAAALLPPSPARLLPWLPFGRRSPAGSLHSEAAEAHRVHELPGWGKLTTRLYSGEVPISKDKAMFYALVEAEGCCHADDAPVVLWLTGWVVSVMPAGVACRWHECTLGPAAVRRDCIFPALSPSPAHSLPALLRRCLHMSPHLLQRPRLLLSGHRLHWGAWALLPPPRLNMQADGKPVQASSPKGLPLLGSLSGAVGGSVKRRAQMRLGDAVAAWWTAAG